MSVSTQVDRSASVGTRACPHVCPVQGTQLVQKPLSAVALISHALQANPAGYENYKMCYNYIA